MGRAFPGKSWRQWNDHFRNAARSFVKGDPGLVGEMMTRLYGSTDLFPDSLAEAYRPWQSVNYVDAHDGLNLCDLVSYTSDSQRSWNCGHEGLSGAPPEVTGLRRRQVKNFCALLMLANGTPMFVAGDEFMHTQGGNANPYDQDNQTTWLDWSLAAANAEVLRFFRLMIALRKNHRSIGRSTGWGADVTWHDVGNAIGAGTGRAAAAADAADAGSATGLAYHLRGASVGDTDLFVMINSHWSELEFALPGDQPWRRVVDTALPTPDDIVDESVAQTVLNDVYILAARSIAVLVALPLASA
jgi:glycogen operon protein